MPRKLEIGPGETPLGPDYETLSARPPATNICRWGEEPMPFPTGTFDIVYSSHVIEHVAWFNVEAALKEAHRILRPGGRLELWTLNLDKLLAAYRKGKPGDNWRRFNPSGDVTTWLNGRLFAYAADGKGEDNWHRSCHTPRSLADAMLRAGFRNVTTRTKREGDAERHGVHHGPCEFGIQGVAWK